MSTVRVDIEPALLEWAVGRAGWDREAARKKWNQFDSWMEGSVKPTFKQAADFANATHTPFGMLFLPEPPVEEVPIPDMRTLGNGVIHSPSADLLDTIYLCQRRQDWYRDYALESGALPLEFIGAASTASAPATVAAQIRKALRIGERQVSTWEEARKDLADRIENLGVLVMVNGIVGNNTHRPLKTAEFRGFALVDDVAPLIFVNGVDSKAAQIFTMVHELAHLWLGHSALSDVALGVRGGKQEELWCNVVAAEVLVPMAEFKAEFQGSVEVSELDRLARHFKVSTLVVLARAREAGALTWEQFMPRLDEERARLEDFSKAEESGQGGNFYYVQPWRVGREFGRAVIRAAQEGTTTYREAYNLLGTKKHSTFEGLAKVLKVA